MTPTYRSFGISVLVALLICVYTLTNAGRFHIIDEVSVFAVTESLALRGSVNTNSIAWTQWVKENNEVMGAFGPEGDVYAKKGPATAFLAVPWYLLLRWLARLPIEFGLLQGVLLWHGFVTALSAALLWLTALRLGYSDRTGALLGLLFGLCTIAWPYANHLFGEPVSGLALLVCYYGILSWQATRSVRWLWLAATGGALAIAAVTVNFVLVALLEAWFFFYEISLLFRPESLSAARRQRLRQPGQQRTNPALSMFYLVAPVILMALLLLWYNASRFGSAFDLGYQVGAGEGFVTPIWQGAWGLLISPYRGVFWHTPLFAISALAFVPFLRRHRGDALLIAAMSGALIAIYSMWWMWWGGDAWGPRFLVPISAFWVLLLAPLFEQPRKAIKAPLLAESQDRRRPPVQLAADRLLEVRSRVYQPSETAPLPFEPEGEASPPAALPQSPVAPAISEAAANVAPTSTTPTNDDLTIAPPLPWRALGVLIVALLSAGVQVLAVVVNYVNYETMLRSIFPSAGDDPLVYGPPAQSLRDLRFSPVFGQVRLMRDNFAANSDLIWLRTDEILGVDVNWLVLLMGLATIGTLALLLAHWWGQQRQPISERERPAAPLYGLVALLPVLMIGVWLNAAASDPHYGALGRGMRGVIEDLCPRLQRNDVVITVAPTAYQIPMNWQAQHCPRGVDWYGLATESASKPEVQKLLARLERDVSHVWFVTGGLQPNDPENTVERWLADHAFKADDRWYDDYRLLTYAMPAELIGAPTQPINQLLTDSQTRTDNVGQQVTVISAQMPTSHPAGEALPVEIQFQLANTATSELRWFVQLLGADGKAVALLDTGPSDNYTSFTTLPVGDIQVERAALLLPDDLPAASYQLIAGLYQSNVPEAPRLLAPDGRDFVVLGTVQVE